MLRGVSLMNKLSGKPKYEDERGNRKWIHSNKALVDHFATYQAKYLGCIEVDAPKGIEIIKDAIKKIQFQHEIKKSEAGKKGSKLPKVEIWISVDIVKIINVKSKDVITQKPLHRISYCADDHVDKTLFSFIAKEQETKVHKCYAFYTERPAGELTVTLGQAFELAFSRYLQKGKESKENREVEELKKQVEQAKAENQFLKQKLNDQVDQDASRRTGSVNSSGSNNSLPSAFVSQQDKQPSLLVDFQANRNEQQQQQDESFDPFDSYLSKLAVQRGFGADNTPEQMPERAPFQSPLQKEPEANPFEFQTTDPSNPFDSFFADSSAAQGNGLEKQSNSPEISATRGVAAPQFLPPPPSKQSIKAANALKMKPAKTKSPEPVEGNQNNANGNQASDFPNNDLFGFGMKNDVSVTSLEQSLGAGLQFDSFNFDPLQ